MSRKPTAKQVAKVRAKLQERLRRCRATRTSPMEIGLDDMQMMFDEIDRLQAEIKEWEDNSGWLF